MTRKHIGILILLLALSACSGKNKYEPFTPLSDAAVSPERAAAVQSALNGNVPVPTAVPEIRLENNTEPLPTFDENSFFAEVGTSGTGQVSADADPFAADPTQAPPTAIPEPTATKPYDPNIMMYGTAAGGIQTYTLQEGDDLVCLGRRFNVAVSDLVAQNNLESAESAAAGDVILLPADPNPWKMTDGYGRRMLITHPAVYTTKSGDTLFSIACAYGDVRPEDLAVQNHLVLGEPLSAGIQINIP